MVNVVQILNPAERESELDTRWSDAALLVLRIATGGLLIVHGLLGAADPQARIAIAQQLGVPLPDVSAILSIAGEIGTSLGVLAGLLTRLSGLLMAILMTITYLSSSIGRPLLDPDTPALNHENAMFFALGGLAIFLAGAGRFGLDHVVAQRAADRKGLRR